jgi:hypothetical protein
MLDLMVVVIAVEKRMVEMMVGEKMQEMKENYQKKGMT